MHTPILEPTLLVISPRLVTLSYHTGRYTLNEMASKTAIDTYLYLSVYLWGVGGWVLVSSCLDNKTLNYHEHTGDN